MSEEKEKLYVFVYKGPNRQDQAYIVDLDNMGNRDWFLQKIGVDSRIKGLEKQINSLQRARHQLQRACLPALVANCKEEMFGYIERNYPDKAFKGDALRDEFDEWYGWEACMKALDQLKEEGKVSYKRGWLRLPKVESKEVGVIAEKVEAVATSGNNNIEAKP